jgi:hypothetical protein
MNEKITIIASLLVVLILSIGLLGGAKAVGKNEKNMKKPAQKTDSTAIPSEKVTSRSVPESLNISTQARVEFVTTQDSMGFRLSLSTDKNFYVYPDPILLTVSLRRKQPIIDATVSAEVEKPDGSRMVLLLYDDGTRRDQFPSDGVYTGVFADFNGNGIYQLRVTADNKAGNAKEGVGFSELPPPGEHLQSHKTNFVKDSFLLKASCQRRVTGFVSRDKMPPGRIDTFDLKKKEKNWIILTWMASGDNAYSGRAKKYEIRMAPEVIQTEGDWKKAKVLTEVSLPKPAGKWEEITLKDLPRGRFFFAIKAMDGAGNWSPISNSVLTIIE